MQPLMIDLVLGMLRGLISLDACSTEWLNEFPINDFLFFSYCIRVEFTLVLPFFPSSPCWQSDIGSFCRKGRRTRWCRKELGRCQLKIESRCSHFLVILWANIRFLFLVLVHVPRSFSPASDCIIVHWSVLKRLSFILKFGLVIV